MAEYARMRQGNNITTYLNEFVVDTEEQINTLPVFSQVAYGSTAFVIESSSTYMLGLDNTWHLVDLNGKADGNYQIIENADLLPDRFNELDRKIYFTATEKTFWFWNGAAWEPIQPPIISVEEIRALFEEP